MKLRKSITAGILLGATSMTFAVEPPPLDRPTPPPCCADGLCYPNCYTWGWYSTRWRRWPSYIEEVAPGVRPPAPLGPDTPPYVAPSPETEDKQAPEPTRPPEEGQPSTAPVTTPRTTTPPNELGTPTDERPTTTPLQPSGPAGRLPTTYPSGTESNGITPLGIPMLPLQGEPPAALPSSEPGGLLPLGEPTGDLDPPPSPPRFGAPAQRDDLASQRQQVPMPKAGRASANTPRPAAHDPPPALPSTIASVAR